MQVETPDFLRLVENAGSLMFFDIEAKGLRGDYGKIICVSTKLYAQDPETVVMRTKGESDKRIIREAKRKLESADCWVSYYGKGFDIPMLNTRLLFHGYEPIEKRPHLDLYWGLRSRLNTSRRSQGHLLSWLGLPAEKMTVGAGVWSELEVNFTENIKTMVKRCESDCKGLEALYDRTKHLVVNISR